MTVIPFYISENDPPAKQRILEEGLHLFASRGLSATSIRDIAAETGYSNPALYKHFKTKEALALTLFERSYQEILKRVSLAVQREERFGPRLRAYVVAFTEFYDAYPDATIFVSENLAALWPLARGSIRSNTLITLTRELLELGRQEGQVAKDADLSLQMILVTGMLGQLTRQLYLKVLKGPAVTHAESVERILRAGLA